MKKFAVLAVLVTGATMFMGAATASAGGFVKSGGGGMIRTGGNFGFRNNSFCRPNFCGPRYYPGCYQNCYTNWYPSCYPIYQPICQPICQPVCEPVVAPVVTYQTYPVCEPTYVTNCSPVWYSTWYNNHCHPRILTKPHFNGGMVSKVPYNTNFKMGGIRTMSRR